MRPAYSIRVATSGARALEVARTDPKPDLILLDVIMPEMDGYACLSRLQSDAETAEIPVIIVTVLDDADDESKGLELGAVDYITKPFRPSIILARIKIHLELKSAREWLEDQNSFLELELARRLKEIQQAQMQLLQSEKMAAIGLLTAGIVHEINNPVGYISTNLDSLETYFQSIGQVLEAYGLLEPLCPVGAAELLRLQQLKQTCGLDDIRDDIGALITETRQGIERVAKIVADLKNYSHAESGSEWKLADLHSGLDSTLNIVWNEIKYHCRLNKQYGEIPEICCLPAQINQVFLNLIVNAAQAIEKQGEITIRTGQTGQEVFVTISDTGTGIAPENLSKLFTPFFTTKPVGKGTGLGLSITHNIIQRHHGRITVESALGQGSTFTIWLPVCQPGLCTPGLGAAS